jgi:prepilin-type processing-associated H-X9-DG protein
MATAIPILKCPSSPTGNPEQFNQLNNTFYGSPANPKYMAGVSDYFCVSNSQTFSPSLNGMMPYLNPPKASIFASTTDGLSNTLAVIEMGGGPVKYLTKRRIASGERPHFHGNWGENNRLSLRPFDDTGTILGGGNCVVNCTNSGSNLYSFHPGGSNAAYGDGSVRFVSQTVDSLVLHYLVGRDEGMVVNAQ